MGPKMALHYLLWTSLRPLTKAQLKESNKAVEDASESEASTEEDRANIGKYTAENGPTRAASYFSAHLRCNVRIMIRSSYKI